MGLPSWLRWQRIICKAEDLGQEYLLEKGMATHSSILAWRIPWTEEPGRLQSMGFQRVGHNWGTNTVNYRRRWPPNTFITSSFNSHILEVSSGTHTTDVSLDKVCNFNNPGTCCLTDCIYLDSSRFWCCLWEYGMSTLFKIWVIIMVT